MPAIVTKEFSDPDRNTEHTVYPEKLWIFPLEDIVVCENRLLLFWCHPNDEFGAFFKSPPLDTFPDYNSTEGQDEITGYCNEQNKQIIVCNETNVPSEKYIDRVIGPFRLVFNHVALFGAN